MNKAQEKLIHWWHNQDNRRLYRRYIGLRRKPADRAFASRPLDVVLNFLMGEVEGLSVGIMINEDLKGLARVPARDRKYQKDWYDR